MRTIRIVAVALATHFTTGCMPTLETAGVEVLEDSAHASLEPPSGQPSPQPSAGPSPLPSPTPSVSPTPAPPPSPSPAANLAPSVNAGADKTFALPASSVSITATASDADGTIASRAWTKVSGPGTQVFSSVSALNTTISGFSAAGTYVFRLTVVDDDGASASDTVQVTVTAAPTPSPTPSASPNPIPSVTIPVVEGLAPPATLEACKLSVWKRNVPGTSPAFNNFDTVVFLPCDYGSDPAKKYPLVISNHGRGGSTLDTATHSTVGGKNFEGFIKQLRNSETLRSTFGAIVLAPDLHAVGDGGDYFPGAAQAHREARLIVDAIKRLQVDPKRVTVTGLSYGGSMTIDMMTMYQGLLAGAMPYAMQPPNKGSITPENTCRWVDFPLWAAGRGDDGVFNYYEWSKNFAGGFKYTLERCPGYVVGEKFQLTNTGTGGHTGWDQFYAMPAVQNWLSSQSQP